MSNRPKKTLRPGWRKQDRPAGDVYEAAWLTKSGLVRGYQLAGAFGDLDEALDRAEQTMRDEGGVILVPRHGWNSA